MLGYFPTREKCGDAGRMLENWFHAGLFPESGKMLLAGCRVVVLLGCCCAVVVVAPSPGAGCVRGVLPSSPPTRQPGNPPASPWGARAVDSAFGLAD